jgi:hypothetical protein
MLALSFFHQIKSREILAKMAAASDAPPLNKGWRDAMHTRAGQVREGKPTSIPSIKTEGDWAKNYLQFNRGNKTVEKRIVTKDDISDKGAK